MKDLFEEYLNWLAKELNTNHDYGFVARFLEVAEFTEAEYYDFMQLLGEHDLVVITELCWERCKEEAKDNG